MTGFIRLLSFIGKLIVWMLTGMLAMMFLLYALVFYAIVLDQPDYDDNDPRHEAIVRQLPEVRETFATIGYAQWPRIDLTPLNGGDWRRACLLGGYTRLDSLTDLGVSLSARDAQRLSELPDHGFRLAEVEEFEVMIAYVDMANAAHIVHFRHGFGPDGQHFKRCISKPRTFIQVSDKVRE